MRGKGFRTRLRLLIVLTLLLVMLTSVAVGKYMQTASFEGKVTFSANLATNIILRESKLERDSDGNYELSDTKYVSGSQEYVLIPGVDVPKNPHIIIEGKTNVGAYLFVEVVSTVDADKLIYSVDDSLWKKLNLTGKHDGDVYVYTGSGNTPLVMTSTPANPIYILQGNKITVSQHIGCKENWNDALTFYASMGDTAINDSVSEIYKAIHAMS